MDVFKKFVDNNRILGYKGKLPLIRDMIDEHTSKKFENLFYSLNLLYEEINTLDSQRKDNDIFKGKKKFNKNNFFIIAVYLELILFLSKKKYVIFISLTQYNIILSIIKINIAETKCKNELLLYSLFLLL